MGRSSRVLDEAMLSLAERQHGVVSRRQAGEVGATGDMVRSRLRSGRWRAQTPRVLRLTGTPATFEQRCMAAVLDAGHGAVVSRGAAAALWRLPGFGPEPVELSQVRGASGRQSPLAPIHRPRFLPDHHVGSVAGIPVTTAARTLFDLAGHLHPLRVERALDNAVSHRVVRLETVRGVTVELLERGRTGSALMRTLLEDRGAGYTPPASGLEAAFSAVLASAGLELPERQVDLGGVGWVARVDYLYRSRRLVIEIDSDRHHTSKLDRESDARRDAALVAAGFRVLRITEIQVRQRPAEVIALVRAALDRAAA